MEREGKREKEIEIGGRRDKRVAINKNWTKAASLSPFV